MHVFTPSHHQIINGILYFAGMISLIKFAGNELLDFKSWAKQFWRSLKK